MHSYWVDAGRNLLDWFQSMFIPALPGERPVLLILDGHNVHITYGLRVVAIKNGAHLLKFPHRTTHILQPLDVVAFASMENSCNIMVDFTRQERKIITKREFPSLLSHLWCSIKPDYVNSGFCKRGIVPFSPQAVSSSTADPSEVFHERELKNKERWSLNSRETHSFKRRERVRASRAGKG